MKNHSVVIDTETDLITFIGSAKKAACIDRAGESVENGTVDEYCNLPIRISNSVEVKPFSICKIQVNSDKKVSEKLVLSGSEKFVNKYNVSIGNSIFSINKWLGSTFVLNPFSKPVKMSRGEINSFTNKISDEDTLLEMSDEKVSLSETLCTLEKSNDLSKIDSKILSLKVGDQLNNEEKLKLYVLLNKCREVFAFFDEEIGCHPSVECHLDTGN